jgi:hypothetical protein
MMIGAGTNAATIVSATITIATDMIAGETTAKGEAIATGEATEHRAAAGRPSPFRMEYVSHIPVASRSLRTHPHRPPRLGSAWRALGTNMAASITAKVSAGIRVIRSKAARAIGHRPRIDCSLLPRPYIWNPSVPRNGGLDGTWRGRADAWSTCTNMASADLGSRDLGLGGREESGSDQCCRRKCCRPSHRQPPPVLLALCRLVDAPGARS